MIANRPEPPWLSRVDEWTRGHGWAADGLLALVCAAVFGALSLSGADGLHWSTGWVVTLAIAFTALHLTVAFRRHAPALAYGAACAAMLAVVLAPDGSVVHRTGTGPSAVSALFLPSSLVFLLDLFGAAARLDPVRSRIALGFALIGVVLAAVSSSDALRSYAGGDWLVSVFFGFALAIGVVLTWSVGRLALVRRQRTVAEQAESARLAALEERTRIAREMHDIVAHSLAVIVRQAEGGAFVAEQDPQRAAQALQTVADTGRDALADMRGLLGVLRDPDAAAGGPQPGLAELPALVDGVREAGVAAELVESGGRFPLSPATELAVYRLAQEGLTNTVKHAGSGARVAVRLDWQPSALTAEVTDDGGAGPAPDPVPGAGSGLRGLSERITAVGGTLGTEPLTRGFRLRASFPRAAAGGPR